MLKIKAKYPFIKRTGIKFQGSKSKPPAIIHAGTKLRLMKENQNISDPDYFYNRYCIELRRAQRNDYKFSLIIIDLIPSDTKIKLAQHEDDLKHVENMIVSTAKTVIRATDAITMSDDFSISILLPDTDQDGGELVLQRLDDWIHELASDDLLPIVDKVSTHLFTYPSQEIEIAKLLTDQFPENTSNFSDTTKTTHGCLKLISKNEVRKKNFNGYHLLRNERGALALENPVQYLANSLRDFSVNWQLYLKRIMDIFGAGLGIIIFSPIILLISIFIKLTSSGPVIFKQIRTGYGGRPFQFYKFRTMFVNDEKIHKKYIREFIAKNSAYETDHKRNEQIYKVTDDPRVTRVGKFLRRTSVDELPQLLNVLKGDMSLVGPRPPLPYEVELYDLWHRRRFLEAKPGITGLWQINGRSSTSFNDMVRLDLAYVNSWSIWLDLKILFKTIKIMLLMDGAY